MPVPFVVAAPVVDIDGTLFIQGGIYLALVVVLRPLLFKPWLAALARRNEAIDGSLEKAKALRLDVETLTSEYDQRLRDARDRAAELRSKIRRDEETQSAKRLAEARSEAATTLETERSNLTAAAQQARGALAGKVGELADQISDQILGRAS